MASDYASGDLDAGSNAEFERALGSSPELKRELEFWENMQGALREMGRPEARVPGAGMSEVIRRRLQSGDGPTSGPSQSAPVSSAPRSVPRWLPGLSAGLAAGILLVLGLDLVNREQRDAPVAVLDDGSSVVLASEGVSPAVVVSRKATTIYRSVEKGSIGVWVRSVRLEGFDQDSGVQIRRMLRGGPADVAGMAPGDVILSMDDAVVTSALDLARVLADVGPGEQMSLRFYQSETGLEVDRQLQVGAYAE
jgi:hypothetical protein